MKQNFLRLLTRRQLLKAALLLAPFAVGTLLIFWAFKSVGLSEWDEYYFIAAAARMNPNAGWGQFVPYDPPTLFSIFICDVSATTTTWRLRPRACSVPPRVFEYSTIRIYANPGQIPSYQTEPVSPYAITADFVQRSLPLYRPLLRQSYQMAGRLQAKPLGHDGYNLHKR